MRGLLASMKVFGISSCSWMEKKVLEQFLLKQPKFMRVCGHPTGKSVLVKVVTIASLHNKINI